MGRLVREGQPRAADETPTMVETRDAQPVTGAARADLDNGSERPIARGEAAHPRTSSLNAGDRRLLALVDAALDRARAAAGTHLVCQSGCTPCCFGPFAITQLDAWRLREGLRALAETEPERAASVSRRAAVAVARQAPAFGAGRAGIFATEAEEERFYEAFASDPCPALDPDSGACTVYAWRPVACRTYGPPVRMGGDDLPACPLCFKGAAREEVEAARQTIDTGHVEDPLTDRVEHETGRGGMTTIAFAIAGGPPTDGDEANPPSTAAAPAGAPKRPLQADRLAGSTIVTTEAAVPDTITETPYRWSRDAYDRAVDAGVFGPDDRLELIHGQLLAMNPQGSRHAAIVGLAGEILRGAFGPGCTVRMQCPLAVGDDSEPEPDVAVVPGREVDYLDAHPTTALLVVEVSDDSLPRDRTAKQRLYASHGIPEYWILAFPDARLEVYRDPADAGYRTVLIRRAGETITPQARPGAAIPVADLLP